MHAAPKANTVHATLTRPRRLRRLFCCSVSAVRTAPLPFAGSGNDVVGSDRFDEAGYIAQRVCLWGNSSFGLEEPPLVSGVPLFIRAVTNSTYGHHGEMALPQMLVADL